MKINVRKGALLATTLAMLFVSVPYAAAQSGEDSGEAQESARTSPEGPTPQLYMLPAAGIADGVSQLVVERVNEAIRRQVDGDRGFDLLPTYREMQSAVSGDPYVVVAEAERLYTSGIGLVRAGEFARAVETLQRAVDMIEGHLVGLDNFGVLTDALAHLALAYYGADFDLDARQYMQRFAQLHPDATLDPELYPEGLRDIFAAEAERVLGAETGILTILSDRDGAQVFIDGELRGQTPLVVEDIGFGHHYLLVRQGDQIHSELMRVRARGNEQTIEVDLSATAEETGPEPLPDFYVGLQTELKSGQFSLVLNPYFSELQGETKADYLAWVLLSREGRDYKLYPFVYRFHDQRMVQGEDVSVNLELSNLRSRVTRLSAIISLLISDMPEDLVVTEVNLLAPPEVETSPVVEAEEQEEVATETEGIDESSTREVAQADESPRDPLPMPTREAATGNTQTFDPAVDEVDEKSKTLRYLGYGGAAALAGGVIAGTIIFLVRGSAEPAGFDAEVEW